MLGILESLDGASNGGSSFTILGDYTTIFTAGVVFTISGTASNNGAWTTVSSSYTAGKTTIITTVAPATQADIGTLVSNTVTEFSVDVGDYNLRLVNGGAGGDSTSVSVSDTGTNPLMASLADFVSIQAAVPGFTGAYIEDMRYRFRNKDDATVVDTLLFTPAITGVVEIIAVTPSL
jgi:hypothetical protein